MSDLQMQLNDVLKSQSELLAKLNAVSNVEAYSVHARTKSLVNQTLNQINKIQAKFK